MLNSIILFFAILTAYSCIIHNVKNILSVYNKVRVGKTLDVSLAIISISLFSLLYYRS